MPSPAFGPFVALYVKEVLGDAKIRALRDDQFGRLVIYWCLMADNGGTLPRDPRDFAAISHVDVRKVRSDFEWLPRFFNVSEDGQFWRSERLENEAKKYASKVDRARHNGRVPHPEKEGGFGADLGGVDHHFSAPDMGVSDAPRSRGVTLTLLSNTPVVPASGDVAPHGRKGRRSGSGGSASTGHPDQDRYVLAAATLMAKGWPSKTEGGQDMPYTSRAALYDRLVALVCQGHPIDQLRARANAYLNASAPQDRGTASVGTKSGQYFFGAKGPWRDYEDVPSAKPLAPERIAEALGDAPPPPVVATAV
jgi:hypothetical protein